MRKLTFTILLLILIVIYSSGCIQQETGPVMVQDQSISGEIKQDQIWSGIIHVTGDIWMDEEVTLTIMPGTTILISAGRDDQNRGNSLSGAWELEKVGPLCTEEYAKSHIDIVGRIIAVGQPDNMIRFTSDAPTPNYADWSEIRLYPRSRIEYSIVEYSGRAGIAWSLPQGQEDVKDADISISNSIIQHVFWGGIALGAGSWKVVSNTISDCGSEGIDAGPLSGEPYIVSNTITNSTVGIATTCGASAIIENNTLIDNVKGILSRGNDTITHNSISSPSKKIHEQSYLGYTFPYIAEPPVITFTGVQIAENPVSTIEFNDISNTQRGISIGPKSDPVLTLRNNNIHENDYNIYSDANIAVDASNNWWGTTNVNEIENKIWVSYPGVTRLGMIKYAPISNVPIPGAGACCSSCSDGTLVGDCSTSKISYYCDASKNLIFNCELCGCPVGQVCENNTCVSELIAKEKPEEQVPEEKGWIKPALSSAGRWVNPTAQNDLISYLSGNFTDTDGDGMTDEAEIKYGFNPHDPGSFPAEPTTITPERFLIPDSQIGAYYEIDTGRITIKWTNPVDGSYALSLKKEGSAEWDIYYGGHFIDYAPVELSKFNLQGDETLIGRFQKYGSDRNWVWDYSQFSIELSKIIFPKPLVDRDSNRISYTFSEDFPKESEIQYKAFLRRVFPILYTHLGPPAENFNTFIKYNTNSSSFMTLDQGRTLLTDGDFIPRLIVHEFIHIWKGKYLITSDVNWDYDPALSGFEEAIAEGEAFEIIHEYVRSYPNDPATIQLLSNRPYQYWSAKTTCYDSIKHKRSTAAGDFWPGDSGDEDRYSIVATTFQTLVRKNPNFLKEFLDQYYKMIRDDPNWRPNRDGIITIWQTLVPEFNGYPLKSYLNNLPVFNGRKLDKGIHVLSVIRQYGTGGEQIFAVGYALSGTYCFDQDGKIWWGVCEGELSTLPSWLKTSKGADGFYYTDMQNSNFAVEVLDAYQKICATYNFKTPQERRIDGSPTGLGWYLAGELAMQNFPVGLYKERITFTDYIPYDEGARETLYFFGLKNFQQDGGKEYVIMIGIDGLPEGKAQIEIGGQTYTSPIQNGTAVFRSDEWRFDMEGQLRITITNNEGLSRSYERMIIESGTFNNYFQQQFIIVDRNFNGIEDQFE